MVNALEGANNPHFFEEEEPYLYVYSKYFQDLLQSIYRDFLTIEQGWNFNGNSEWFLESIQNYVEFVPILLEQLRVRAVLPFLQAFGLVGTYQGFAQACIGLFGEDVVIEYVDASYEINIGNITTPVSNLFIAEGRGDFNFVTEDGVNLLKTEDIFVPPSGLSSIREVLRKFLPAEHSEVVTINFITM